MPSIRTILTTAAIALAVIVVVNFATTGRALPARTK